MLQRRYRAAALAVALLSGTGTGAAASQPSVQAIHKQQTIKFHFQSFTTFYSCDALEERVERILRGLGAQAKVKARAIECPTGPARTPYVSVEVTSPIEATPEALAAWEKDKTRKTRELAARVKGERLEGGDAAEQFAAHWQRVSISRGEFDLEPGDCELVQELRRRVLPKLAVRIVKDNLSCPPHARALGQPSLEVEALVRQPEPDDKAANDEKAGS